MQHEGGVNSWHGTKMAARQIDTASNVLEFYSSKSVITALQELAVST